MALAIGHRTEELVLCFVSNCHKYHPFVVSLSLVLGSSGRGNHEWLCGEAFDKLTTNG